MSLTSQCIVILLAIVCYGNCLQLSVPCQAEYCDRNWTPFENMNHGLQGYNIRNGNPMHKINDPGFKSQIFNAVKIVDQKVQLESGIIVNDVANCNANMEKRTFTTLNSYRDYLTKETSSGRDLQIGTETEVTVGVEGKGISASGTKTIPPPFTRAYGDSSDMKDIKSLFTEKKGFMTVSTASCFLYKMTIIPYKQPPFLDEFVEALGILYSKRYSSAVAKKEEFRKFIDIFGTHYQREVLFGSKIMIRTTFTGDVKRNSDIESLKRCNFVEGSTVFGIQVEESRKGCNKEKKTKIQNRFRNQIHTQITTRGSTNIATSISEWNQDKQFKPIPLKFKLAPIVNLMVRAYIDDRNLMYNNQRIISKEIRKWFVPLYFDYCKTMGIDCDTEIKEHGCGIDDSCTVNEECSTDAYKSLKCLPLDQQYNKACTEKYTRYGSDGNGEVFFLDRHDMKCGENEAISYFRLERRGGEYRYKYECCPTFDSCANRLVRNDFTPAYNAYYLDRQHIQCNGDFITSLSMNRDGNNLRYSYDCCASNKKKICYTSNTDYTYSGEGNTVYLDRQSDLKCKSGFSFTSIRLKRDGDQWMYEYKCCKATKKVEVVKGETCSKATTNCDSDGEGRVYYLDRHDLKCPYKHALKSFQLKRCGTSQYQYVGECCKIPDSVTKVSKYTDYTRVDNSKAVFLDRQTVECPGDNYPSYMTSFELESGSDKIRYRYNCYSALYNQKSCYEDNTLETFNGGNDGNTIFLDRQTDIKCGANYFLSKFKMIRDGDRWKYSYRCCKSR